MANMKTYEFFGDRGMVRDLALSTGSLLELDDEEASTLLAGDFPIRIVVEPKKEEVKNGI